MKRGGGMPEKGELTGNNAGNNKVQNIIEIRDRSCLKLLGVQRVEDFDREEVALVTSVGRLVVRGKNLHMSQLLPDQEELSMDGEIDSLCFEEEPGAKRRGFLARLTK